jgi:hypothetical protein
MTDTPQSVRELSGDDPGTIRCAQVIVLTLLLLTIRTLGPVARGLISQASAAVIFALMILIPSGSRTGTLCRFPLPGTGRI